MKNILFTSLLAIVFLISVNACKSVENTSQEVNISTLENNLKDTWELQWTSEFEVDKASFPIENPVLEINPADSTFKGSTGCNQLGGLFESEMVDGFKVVFVRTTKKACPGVKEAEYLALLNRVTMYKRESLELTLLEGTVPLLRYKIAK